jgi:hypothetical protein
VATVTTVGGDCQAAQCAKPLVCGFDLIGNRVAFTCKRWASIGADCSPSSGNFCDYRSYCDPAINLCAVHKAVGVACSGPTGETLPSCVLYAFCDKTTSTCRAYRETGESCDPAISSQCEPFLKCDPTTSTCQPIDNAQTCANPNI